MAHMSKVHEGEVKRVCEFQESAHIFQKSAIYLQQTKEEYQMAAISKL